MDRSNSSGALLEIQGDHAWEWRQLRDRFGGASFDTIGLEETHAAMNVESAHDGLDNSIRLGTDERDQLKQTNLALIARIRSSRRAAIELKNACRRRDEFAARIAHELRSPLNAIQSALAIAGRRDATSETVDVAREMIGRQVRNISRLIDDLLDVSRTTHGKITLRRRSMNLATAVRNSVDTCFPLIESRQQTIDVSLSEDPIMLEADSGRLEQVLCNLLNNAAKYTKPGGRLSVRASLEGGLAVLRVKDTGIGMTEKILSKVFDPFVQAESSLDHSQGGLGIGLTIVRSLVELHGGTVTAQSDGLGRGSEFTVRLPAGREIEAAQAWNEAERPVSLSQLPDA
jgi:signal transduction histidine kinase